MVLQNYIFFKDVIYISLPKLFFHSRYIKTHRKYLFVVTSGHLNIYLSLYLKLCHMVMFVGPDLKVSNANVEDKC